MQDYAIALVLHVRASSEEDAFGRGAEFARWLDLNAEEELTNPLDMSALFCSNAYVVERSDIDSPDFDLELRSHGKLLRPERSET